MSSAKQSTSRTGARSGKRDRHSSSTPVKTQSNKPRETEPKPKTAEVPKSHQCFAIKELLHMIMLACDDSTLASLAATCKLLCDAALDQLWRKRCGMAELLKCLPSTVLDVDDNRRLLLKDTSIARKHWKRFLSYSERVRELVIGHPSCTFKCDDNDALGALAEQNGPQYLFPNLRRLEWLDTDRTSSSRIHIVFSPRLETLVLRLPDRHSTMLNRLTYLGEMCPDLRTLEVRIEEEKALDILETVIPDLKKLQTLIIRRNPRLQAWDFTQDKIPALSASLYEQISLLPELKTFETDCELPGADPQTPRRGFKSLQTFHLQGKHNAVIYPNHMRAYRMHGLRSIIVDLRDEEDGQRSRPQASTVQAILEAARDILPRTGLRRFSLTSRETWASPITRETLKPLLSFTALETLEIDGCVDLILPEYEEIAKTFPELRQLKIYGAGTVFHLPYHSTNIILPPIDVLELIVRHCPKLEDLAVEFTTDELDEEDFSADVMPYGDKSYPNIKKFGVGSVDIKSSKIAVVAAIFSYLFPRLRVVEDDFDEERSGTAKQAKHWRHFRSTLRSRRIANCWVSSARVTK